MTPVSTKVVYIPAGGDTDAHNHKIDPWCERHEKSKFLQGVVLCELSSNKTAKVLPLNEPSSQPNVINKTHDLCEGKMY